MLVQSFAIIIISIIVLGLVLNYGLSDTNTATYASKAYTATGQPCSTFYECNTATSFCSPPTATVPNQLCTALTPCTTLGLNNPQCTAGQYCYIASGASKGVCITPG